MLSFRQSDPDSYRESDEKSYNNEIPLRTSFGMTC